MFIIAVLLVLTAICAMWTYRNNVSIVNSFRDSFQEKETERLCLITDIKDAIEQLENERKYSFSKAVGDKPILSNTKPTTNKVIPTHNILLTCV